MHVSNLLWSFAIFLEGCVCEDYSKIREFLMVEGKRNLLFLHKFKFEVSMRTWVRVLED